ncbi:MAG: D-alanine--D-alanine ligase [Lutibacter sp.]|uniref:D-alanine--D-alanine ligase n=1 Tax=Lutibacter sp. TaxID=1925666 RepID=UPI00385F2A4F
MRKIKNTLHKILHWEYWNINVVYFPIYFYWIFLSIKAKSLGFFNASNPRIKNGGFAMESKKEIYDLIPKKYIPETLFFKENETVKNILNTIHNSNIQFPFIIKPDIGLQGLRVAKIETVEELKVYLKKATYNFIIQEFAQFPLEIGIFYYRMPNETKGKITGIVYKDFLIVEGNGIHSIEELITQNPRFALQLDALRLKFGNQLKEILQKDEKRNLVPFGNHVRGCKFTDVSDWITDELTETFNTICTQIPDFYFGRLDIMYHSRKDLEKGKNFYIIELNGAGSEPTHMYDPKHSIFFAWKEIIKHYNILYKISAFNHQKGYSYLNMNRCRQMVLDNKTLTNHLKSII